MLTFFHKVILDFSFLILFFPSGACKYTFHTLLFVALFPPAVYLPFFFFRLLLLGGG